jgi:O-antigen ligase
MAMNGIILITTVILAFSIGLAIKGKEQTIRHIISFIINLITINAFVNVIAWAIQTKGVVGRYNFDLPIISSFGINIQWSILGFVLQISKIKRLRSISIDTVKLLILLLSIMIILSRENQVIFVIVLIAYQFLSVKKIKKPIIIFYVLIFIISIVFYAQSFLNSTVFNSYQEVANLKGDDFLVRYNNIISALHIFKNHILLGIGYGMFAGYNKTAVSITGVNFYLSSVHNGIISILTEMGFIGLIVNVVLASMIIYRMNKIRKHKSVYIDDNKYILAIFVFTFINIFAALISNYFLLPPPSEYSYYGVAVVSWFLIGLVLSFEKKTIVANG